MEQQAQIRLPDDLPLNDVQMSNRAKRALLGPQYIGPYYLGRPNTVGDLRRISDLELLKIRNLGKWTLTEIRKFAAYEV